MPDTPHQSGTDKSAQVAAPPPYRLLYIAGYGRSGSTLLDRMLDTSDDIRATGELTHLAETLSNDYVSACGCGVAQTNCPFWRPILIRLRDHLAPLTDLGKFGMLARLQERLPRPWARPPSAHRALYLDYQRRLFDAIHAADPSVRVISDSSKTVWSTFRRPHLLRRHIDPQLATIHLVRDARATAWSNIRFRSGVDSRDNWWRRKYVFAKSMVSWNAANLAALTLKTGPYLLVRYDKLAQSPDIELRRISQWLGLAPPRMERINEPNHIYTGNASRLRPITEIRSDSDYRNHITALEHVLYAVLAFPSNLIVGRSSD